MENLHREGTWRMVYAATPYSEHKLYKSIDAGETWTPAETGLLPPGANPAREVVCLHALIVDPQNRDRLLVACWGNDLINYEPRTDWGIYESTNGGESWARFLPRSPDPSLSSMALAPSGHLLAGTESMGVLHFGLIFIDGFESGTISSGTAATN